MSSSRNTDKTDVMGLMMQKGLKMTDDDDVFSCSIFLNKVAYSSYIGKYLNSRSHQLHNICFCKPSFRYCCRWLSGSGSGGFAMHTCSY